MTVELLSAIAGILLSLAFSYIPGLKTWYDQLAADAKRLVMLGALFLVAAAIYGLSCAGIYQIVPCDQAGLVKMIEIFVLALVANQSTFLISPRKPAGS
jgi:uncharacterized membrane protein